MLMALLEVWTSRVPCYEGDGDFIDGDDGTSKFGFSTVPAGCCSVRVFRLQCVSAYPLQCERQ